MLDLIYIRAYGPTVSGRNPGTPELQTGADTLIHPAHFDFFLTNKMFIELTYCVFKEPHVFLTYLINFEPT
jgi:hypothetical protein